jgi:hypothetical protein
MGNIRDKIYFATPIGERLRVIVNNTTEKAPDFFTTQPQLSILEPGSAQAHNLSRQAAVFE